MAAYDEDSVLRRGRGRPKKERAYTNTLTLRLDDDDEAILKCLEVETDDSKSDIMRKALRMYYKIESNKW